MATSATKETVIRLSSQDEIAPRNYIRFFLCFAFKSSPASVAQAVRTLAKAHGNVLKLWPHLTGVVELATDEEDQGRTILRVPDEKSNYPRHFRIEHHNSNSFGFSFKKLQTDGFPCAPLLGDVLAPVAALTNASQIAPAFATQVNFIDGGIILALYLHHSIADGVSMGELVNTFAAETHSNSVPVAPRPAVLRTRSLEEAIAGESTGNLTSHSAKIQLTRTLDCEELLKQCPEYCLDAEQRGPSQLQLAESASSQAVAKSPMAVVIMVFRQERLLELKALATSAIARAGDTTVYVTTNDCLAALIWAFVTRARTMGRDHVSLNQQSRIILPIDHRQKINPPLSAFYFGNAVSLSMTSQPIMDLVESCVEPGDTASINAFTKTALTIREAVLAVDDDFVRKRLALSRSLPDVRRLGLTVEPDGNWDMSYNTWACFGADSLWNIPGVPLEEGKEGARPACIRRGQHGLPVNGVSIVLPKRRDKNEVEVLFQLRAHDMVRLCKDEGWKYWVERMVGI